MEKRIPGLDYLRAIMSVFVVIWHMGGDGGSLFFKYYLLGVAVPCFILISNYLFARKNQSAGDLSRQIKRILLLLGFWPALFILYTKTGILGPVDLLPHSPQAALVFLLRGGNTIYYFFVSLLITSFMVFFLSKLSTRIVWIVFFVTCLFLGSVRLMDLQEMFGSYKLGYYWNPTNFFPYPPAAILITRLYSRIGNNVTTYLGTMGTLLVISVFIALMEWTFYIDPASVQEGTVTIPIYARVSVVLLSIILLIVSLDERIPQNSIILFMSRHSLALYCLHPFLMGPVKNCASKILLRSDMISLYVSILVVIISSYMLSVLLGTFLKKELIR